MTVAALYVSRSSIYRRLPRVEVWDLARDAVAYPGPWPVVAHPPCRAWGRLRGQAKPRQGERELAFSALSKVRAWGGVLEHPTGSLLWSEAGMPRPGEFPDEWGGVTVQLDQVDFGHRARKSTWLYLVGIPFTRVPVARSCAPVAKVENMGRQERERTPEPFARLLVDLARDARGSASAASAAPPPSLIKEVS